MNNPSSITLAYIETKPSSAAGDLSIMPAKEAADFLQMVPLRYTIKVMEFASSWSSAAIIQFLPNAISSSILSELPFGKSVEILSLMAPEYRGNIIAAVPKGLRKDYKRALSYPVDTVGAAMTIDTLSVRAEMLVSDVLNELRKDLEVLADIVFVVSEKHKVLGAATPLDLIRAPTKAKIGDIMTTQIPSISARSRISSIENLEAWDQYSTLPVLSLRGNLVGVLRREEIGVDDTELDQSEPYGHSIIGALLAAFVFSGVEFSKLLGGEARRNDH